MIVALALPAGDTEAAEPFLADPDANFHWTTNNCCGLVATYIVCRDLGRPVELRALARELPVSEKGTSLDAMAQCLASRRLRAQGVRVSAETLYQAMEAQPELRAIVGIRHHHWVTLGAARDGNFAVFDYPEWHTVAVDKLADQFEGHALLVVPENSASAVDALMRGAGTLRHALVGAGAMLVFAGVALVAFDRRRARICFGAVSR